MNNVIIRSQVLTQRKQSYSSEPDAIEDLPPTLMAGRSLLYTSEFARLRRANLPGANFSNTNWSEQIAKANLFVLIFF